MAFSLAARLGGRSSLFGLRSDPLTCGLRFGLQRPGGLGSPFLPARVLASSSFASQAEGGPPQGPPSSFGGPPHHGASSSLGGPPLTTLATPPRRTRPGMLPSPMALEFLAPQKMLSFAIQYILSFRFYFMFMARTTFQAVRPLLAFSVFGEVMKMVLATMSSGLFSFLFSFVLAFEVLYFFLQCYISYTFLTMFFTVMF
ncbi:hypothetical protein Emed_001095 [Eimeria media]